MSYKSLLFCADEKTARLVTQVLSELDFTVELAKETYATAKKLAEEHFDALVVDCQNEQDASVLFKAARNSAENHSSLSVAVVDGQAGVAKAFRIGANLVLTKPINVEQSKNTLRVARGLLKKNQPKPTAEMATASAPTSTFIPPTPKPGASGAQSSLPPAFIPVAPAAPAAAAAHASAPTVPYSSLQVERDPEPVTELSDLAALESMPQLPVTKAADSILAPPSALDKPFAVSLSAAAAAPAVEKKPVDLRGMSLVTNEPIVREASAPSPFEMHAPVPTFSTLDSRPKEGGEGAKGIFKTIMAFALLGVAFYLGWQKLPILLQNHKPSWPSGLNRLLHRQKTGTPAAEPKAVAQPIQQTQPSAQTIPALPATPDVANTPPASDEADQKMPPNAEPATQSASAPENVKIEEMPISRDGKVTVTPKAQPLVVKNDSPKASTLRPAAVTAPSLDVANTGTDSPIADLVTSNAPWPNPAPGTVRISQGVSQALLIKKVSPVYPAVAIQMHREGTVEMLATISKTGQIANVKVLHGDPMLARAAVDAVKQWQYRPYLLNEQPLDIETQISIAFRLPK